MDGRLALREIAPLLGDARRCSAVPTSWRSAPSSRRMRSASQVPDRLAVCGFGDFELSRASEPSITTVSVDGAEMGRIAAENLLRG